MDDREELSVRIPKPKIDHPPEVYEAIIRECGRKPLRIGELLQACGWSLADAAWAVVNWDLPTLAAALANERARRHTKLASLSDAEVAKIKAELDAAAARQAGTNQPPRKTTRVVGTTPRLTPRPPKKPDAPRS